MISKSIVTATAATISCIAISASITNPGEMKLVYVGTLQSSVAELIPALRNYQGTE